MKNLSPLDRDVRIAIVAPLLFLYGIGSGITTVGGALLLSGAALTTISAFTAYSPLYALFGIDHYHRA